MKMLMVIAPVVIIGVVAGLGFSGVIQIPGITPKKAAKAGAAMYAQKDDKALAQKGPATTAPPKTPDKTNPPPKKVTDSKAAKKDAEQGADALATVWNDVQTPDLLKIAEKWKDDDFARVLAHMDSSKVAEILESLAQTKPERASKLSRALQDLGSVVKVEG